MTDRELLELAAKAAGIHPHDIECTWNPLTHDGDALRLAVKLGSAIVLHTKLSEGTLETVVFNGDICTIEPHGSDPYAATRRAIVRAAAEIGGTS